MNNTAKDSDDVKPMRIVAHDLLNYQLQIMEKLQVNLHLRENIVNIRRSNNGVLSTKEYSTYDIPKNFERFTLFTTVEDYGAVENTLISVTFKQSNMERLHLSTHELLHVLHQNRINQSFSILATFSEFGGSLFLLSLLLSVLAHPLSSFSFHLTAIQALF